MITIIRIKYIKINKIFIMNRNQIIVRKSQRLRQMIGTRRR